MSQTSPSSTPSQRRAASVVPLHGGRTHAPSSVLVRARLGETLDAARVRAAVAFFGAACDAARRAEGVEARWWGVPVALRSDEIARETLLAFPEAEDALGDLEEAELLVSTGRGHRIEADVLCECPALATFDLDAARSRLHAHGKLVGPATALLREVVRLADGGGVASTTIPRLVDETLFGRTRVTQALGVLQDVGLVERRDLANRMVRLHLMGAAADAALSLPRPPERRTEPPAVGAGARGGRMRLPTGAPIQVAGQPLDLAPGMVPELELAEDGRYYLWIGPVRIGPYEE